MNKEKRIHVYETLDGDFRAYIKGNSNLQAFGSSADEARKNLLKLNNDVYRYPANLYIRHPSHSNSCISYTKEEI